MITSIWTEGPNLYIYEIEDASTFHIGVTLQETAIYNERIFALVRVTMPAINNT